MSNGKILKMKPTTKPQKATRTTVDTVLFTRESITTWENPLFQRPLKINDKVKQLSEQIKEDAGVLPGIITLGVLGNKTYLIDGQHRREAFLLSGLEEGFSDIRTHHFESMAEMGDEFVRLNSSLVRLRPDDVLRGLEGSLEALQMIRKKCPYVGYDMIRRNDRSPLVSMSTLLRCWVGSSTDVPASGGVSAQHLATTLTKEEATTLIAFLQVAESSWGRDYEYARLWSTLNLTICMWLYRRMVVTQYSPRTPRLTHEGFGQCLMALSANGKYVDWLRNRGLRDQDRAPAYNRIRVLFASCIQEGTGRKALMPAPAWATHASGR